MLQRTIVFLSLACAAFAAVALGPLQKKPEKFANVEGCYFSDLDSVIPFGKSAPAKDGCLKYQCGPSHVDYISCGRSEVSPPCYMVEDKTKPYPDCCPKIKC